MAHVATPQAQVRQQHYAVPQPMPWPIMGSTSLFLMALGAAFVFNDIRPGWISIAAGFLLLLYMMVRWFGDVIRESEGGKYGRWEDVSFRWGMSFFIFSEVMFFGGFFGALFWTRCYHSAFVLIFTQQFTSSQVEEGRIHASGLAALPATISHAPA